MPPPMAGGEAEAPLHLAPSSHPMAWGEIPESQFLVLVKGTSGEHAEAGPPGSEIQSRDAGGKETIQVRALQQMETNPKLAELHGGFVSSRVEKCRFLPNIGSLDTPPPPPSADIASPCCPWLWVPALGLIPSPSPGKEDFSGPEAPLKSLSLWVPKTQECELMTMTGSLWSLGDRGWAGRLPKMLSPEGGWTATLRVTHLPISTPSRPLVVISRHSLQVKKLHLVGHIVPLVPLESPES